MNILLNCFKYYFYIGIFDYLFTFKVKSRYFLLHSIINGYMIYLCSSDTINILWNTVDYLKLYEVDNTPLCVMLSLHLYHITPFIGFSLNYLDYLHHISSAFLGGVLLIFANYGPLQNYNFMFVCGLPGFIDYLLLVGVKENYIDRLTEKYYNNLLNLWIRSPFLIASVIFSWIQIQLQSESNKYVIIIRYFCMIIQYWNAQFFLEKVVKSYWLNKN